MYISTKRVKVQKLGHTAKRAIEDRNYWLNAYTEAAAEIRRLRSERNNHHKSNG